MLWLLGALMMSAGFVSSFCFKILDPLRTLIELDHFGILGAAGLGSNLGTACLSMTRSGECQGLSQSDPQGDYKRIKLGPLIV